MFCNVNIFFIKQEFPGQSVQKVWPEKKEQKENLDFQVNIKNLNIGNKLYKLITFMKLN